MKKSIIVFGFHSIKSLLNENPQLIVKTQILNTRKDKRITDLLNLLTIQKIPFSFINKDDLDKISKGEVHQGVISEVLLPSVLNE